MQHDQQFPVKCFSKYCFIIKIISCVSDNVYTPDLNRLNQCSPFS